VKPPGRYLQAAEVQLANEVEKKYEISKIGHIPSNGKAVILSPFSKTKY
jgi:hypothetical protein